MELDLSGKVKGFFGRYPEGYQLKGGRMGEN